MFLPAATRFIEYIIPPTSFNDELAELKNKVHGIIKKEKVEIWFQTREFLNSDRIMPV